MSFFLDKKKSLLDAGLLMGMTDVHAHLINSVDDGVATFEEAQRIVSYLESIGVKRMFLTPHVMSNFPKNNRESLIQCFEAFRTFCNSSVEFILAAEYMLEPDFIKHLNEGLLTLGDSHVMVETSYMSPPINLDTMLFDIKAAGYIPILAHPERYMYMNDRQFDSLKNIGVKLQLNLLSLGGYYGRGVMKRAEQLLKENKYDFAGSDMHRFSQYQQLCSGLKLSKNQLNSVIRLLDNNKLL